MRVLRTGYESSLHSQPRHANRITSLDSPSFSATDPLSRLTAAAQMRRRRAGRSFRARDTTFIQVSTHGEAHGDRRHTGWMGMADAWQSAPDRLLTWSGHELSDSMHEARTYLKLKVTTTALTSK